MMTDTDKLNRILGMLQRMRDTAKSTKKREAFQQVIDTITQLWKELV